jgi:hypothetical protein
MKEWLVVDVRVIYQQWDRVMERLMERFDEEESR